MEKETIIISLGGSLIIPEEIDISFLKNFREIILEQVSKNKKFVIITGGGRVCRKYQQAAKKIMNPSNDDLDWIGIASLKLNAELLRVIFGNLAFEKVIGNLGEDFDIEKPIIIGSAYKPGQSTDWDAILAAKKLGAKKVINLSNIDCVHDVDPKINPNAKTFEKISWAEYRSLIPEIWNPGLNTPFDPIASKLAEENNIEVIIMNGNNIANLENYLNGQNFKGTTIS
jgi:uridylate kinase